MTANIKLKIQSSRLLIHSAFFISNNFVNLYTMKSKLKDGLETDVICKRRLHGYLKNNPVLVKFAKNKINRRERRRERDLINNEL